MTATGSLAQRDAPPRQVQRQVCDGEQSYGCGMDSEKSLPKLQVQTQIDDDHDPAVVTVTTEGRGQLRVVLNGTAIFDGTPFAGIEPAR